MSVYMIRLMGSTNQIFGVAPQQLLSSKLHAVMFASPEFAAVSPPFAAIQLCIATPLFLSFRSRASIDAESLPSRVLDFVAVAAVLRFVVLLAS